MLNKLSVLQIDYSQEQENKLLLNGQPFSLVKRGFLTKHQCLLDADNSVWLTIKKKSDKDFRLVFVNGSRYQLEVLTYSNLTFVFYDKEDTELFRLTQPAFSPDAICLLISEDSMPEEEFATMVAWGFYFCRHYKEKKNYKPAA
jgi:hypothetical protein